MRKQRAIIFGAGGTGKRVYNMVKDDVETICFVDNDSNKWGMKYDSLCVETPEILKHKDKYDVVIMGTLMGLTEVQEQLRGYNVSPENLDKSYVEISVKARILFLKRFAERVVKENIEGAVAEAGVFRGEFAKYINEFFKDRITYLFDTFEGFDERDFKFEEKLSNTTEVDHLRDTSVDLVFNKMPYKEKIVIKKGYFPASLGDLEDTFAFVNLDMDLYQPTLEGLRYFYPRMSNGGVILIHDYFTEIFPNIEKAVDDFENEIGQRLYKMPIGDDITMAIIK